MINEPQLTQTAPDLFEEDDLNMYTYASSTQRFFNLLIDTLFMQYGLAFATAFIIIWFLELIAPAFVYSTFADQEGWDFLLAAYIMSIFNYLIYYFFCEKFFNGYTLGKLITGTRAIREDGKELTFRDAFLRTLSRMVPFEAFSGFGGHPWHDTWTKTMVIKTR